MSKIKLLYDVITTMKDKESFSGNIKVEGRKDQVKIFGLDNEFEKNIADGRMKAKFSLEVDCDGKIVKHESSTEFDGSSCHGASPHGFMGRMISHHCHGHQPNHGHIEACCGPRRCGIKGGLARLSFLLSILNSMKVKEQEDKSSVLSLDFNEIPGEMKQILHEKFLHIKMHHDHGHQCMFKEFSTLEILNAGLNILINKNKEVEKITLIIEGQHPLNLQAELRFNW
ncbi:MAG: hypothetical protein ACYDEQ_14570 [Desulfocucumaceae bacterium]